MNTFIAEDMSINRVRTYGEFAYLTYNDGIIVIDIEKREIRDGWKPSVDGTRNEVFDFNIFEDTANIGGFRLRPIQVKCNFEDPNNHTFKVQLRINGEDMGFGTWNSETECFEWYWTGLAIGKYDLMCRYIDEHGAVYWAYMSVWNFCFLL